MSFLSHHLTFTPQGTGLQHEVELEGTVRVGVLPPSKGPGLALCAARAEPSSMGSRLAHIDPSSRWPAPPEWVLSLEASLPQYCHLTVNYINKIFKEDL